jgi:hypothetical protein
MMMTTCREIVTMSLILLSPSAGGTEEDEWTYDLVKGDEVHP